MVILFLGFSCVNIIFVKCLWLCFPGSPRRMAGFYFCPNMLYILKHIRFMHGEYYRWCLSYIWEDIIDDVYLIRGRCAHLMFWVICPYALKHVRLISWIYTSYILDIYVLYPGYIRLIRGRGYLPRTSRPATRSFSPPPRLGNPERVPRPPLP